MIAGGSEGVGAEFAALLAAAGVNLVLIARKPGPLEHTAARCRQSGVETRTLAIDLVDEVEGQLLRHLLERSGSIEELVDRSGQPPASVASALTLLESRGLVNPFGGATFHPTLAAKRLAGVV